MSLLLCFLSTVTASSTLCFSFSNSGSIDDDLSDINLMVFHALLFSTIDPSASHDIAETTLPAIRQDVAPIKAALVAMPIL